MSKTLAVDENNDLYLLGDGVLAVRSGVSSVMQCAAHAAKAQLGEMVLAIDEGVPNFQTIWESSANVAQFEAYIRAAIIEVPGVLEIEELNVAVRDNAVFYDATIKTIFGTEVLNG